MEQVLEIVKFIPVLIAAYLLGNWFLVELRKARAQEKPWYSPYLSIPGILIILAILLPIIIKILSLA